MQHGDISGAGAAATLAELRTMTPVMGSRRAIRTPRSRCPADHFPVEVGARAVMQFVDTDRRQQRFDACDQRNGEDTERDGADLMRPRLSSWGHLGKFGQANRVEEVALQVDSFGL